MRDLVRARTTTMRGVAFIVAVTVVSEAGDFHRSGNPRQLMAQLGLTPQDAFERRQPPPRRDHQGRQRACTAGPDRGGMEQPRVSRKLHDRVEGLPAAVRDIAWKGQLRMCPRYRRLAAAGKPKVVVTTAIAREMVGFIWAIARTVAADPARAAVRAA